MFVIISKILYFHPQCACTPGNFVFSRTHMTYFSLSVFTYTVCVFDYIYGVQIGILHFFLFLSWHSWFMMFHRRIQRCWLFPCQLFHMQLSPLLTLPLMLDHRWKSSSHPADASASDFHECFFIQLPERKQQQDKQFYWCQKTCHYFLFSVILLIFFFYHHTYLLCSNRVEKKERGQEKSQHDGCVYNKEKMEYVCLICM